MWTTLSNLVNREPAGTRRAARRFVPRLQPLDDRLAPAAFTVTQPLDLVEPDNTRSLREAITLANATPEADTIQLPVGTFQMSLFGAEDDNVGGDFDIRGSVTLTGAGAGRTIISGTTADRVFQVFGTSPSSIKVTFQNLTIRGGLAQFGAPGDFPNGGAVDAGNADVTFRDCILTQNAAGGRGGAVAGTSGALTLIRTTVGRNHADMGGGIFWELGPTRLNGSTVRLNQSDNGGGGVFGDVVTLTNSTVCGIRSTAGGGIFSTVADLTDSTVRGNFASFFGGGIAAPATTMTNCTVSGNAAGQSGGGINAATVSLTNVTVSGNSTDGEGGGVFAAHGAIVNCTIVENVALFEGGGLSWAGEDDPIHVLNTMVALNVALAAPDVDGTFVSIGNNLIGVADGSAASFTAVADQVGSQADPLDPKIGALINNGGRTQTRALLAGSPAIDRGSNTGGPGTDQRGVRRPRDGDGNGTGVVDIGAFER